MPTKTESAQLTLHREYNAPLETVWVAWTDAEQIGQWWGPRGFTITTHSRDLRSGGTWKYTMHGPDGVDYENFTKYLEVEKHKKLVYDHGGTATSNPLFRVSVMFSAVGDKTKMDMTMEWPNAELAEASRRFIKKAGGEATWDRLAEFLEKKVSNKDVFVINRSFDAPIELIFDMWTNPEHVAQWMAPTGFSMKYNRCNLKAGGDSFYSMTNGQGVTMHGLCQYQEIRKPDLIVYTQQFADENEKISRHPMAPTWPESMLTKVQMTSEGPQKTRVTITWEPFGTCTKDELDTCLAARGGMTQGWTGSFDKLEEYLEKQ